MAWFDIIWNYNDEDGNVEHVAQHDLTPEDISEVLENPIREEISESSGRPIAFGYTPRRKTDCGCLRRESTAAPCIQ